MINNFWPLLTAQAAAQLQLSPLINFVVKLSGARYDLEVLGGRSDLSACWWIVWINPNLDKLRADLKGVRIPLIFLQSIQLLTVGLAEDRSARRLKFIYLNFHQSGGQDFELIVWDKRTSIRNTSLSTEDNNVSQADVEHYCNSLFKYAGGSENRALFQQVLQMKRDWTESQCWYDGPDCDKILLTW